MPLQVLGCGGADSIQHRVRPWPPDFGHFISHDSFTQPQVELVSAMLYRTNRSFDQSQFYM